MTAYTDAHAEDNTLIELRINIADMEEQLNYLKTVHLLNKEPVLEKLITKIEFMLESAKVKIEKDKENYKLQERTRYEQEYRYAQDQMAMSKRAQLEKNMEMLKYTAGTPIGMDGQNYNTGVTKIDSPFAEKYVKGKFDPPF